jgi:hypothetical protein
MIDVTRSWTALVGDHGPDHFMELVFDRDPRAQVRAFDTSGFVRTALAGQPMFSSFRGELGCAAFDLLVDELHSERLLGILAGTLRENLWHYATVLVGADRIWIEHGYGWSSPDTNAAEQRLLAWAVQAGSGLVSWSIEYGGQGYPETVARAGSSAADLAAALG